MISSRADVALADFSYFIGHYFEKKLWKCQEVWADKFQLLIDSDARGLQLLAPADHGKTSTCVVPGIAWLLARDPDNRIGLLGNTDPYAQQISRLIMTHIERNRKLQTDFGLRRGDKWSAEEFTVERPKWDMKDASVLAVGVGAELQSQRFDYLFLDDAATRKNSASEISRDKLRSYFFTDAMSRLDKTNPYKNKVAVFGHRVEAADLYQAQQGKKDWIYHEDKAIIDDGEQLVLAPEGHSYEELSEHRKDDPVGFELVYQQRPVPTGRFITRASIEKCRRNDLRFHLNNIPHEVRSDYEFTWLAVDPAFSTNRWSSFMVMTLWGMRRDRKTRTLLWGMREKVVPETLLRLMEMKFRIYRPDHFLIEANQGQVLLIPHMQKQFPDSHSKFKKVFTTNGPSEGPKSRLETEVERLFDLFSCDPPLIELPYYGATERAFVNSLTDEFLGYPDIRYRDILSSMYIGEKGLGLIKDESRKGYIGRGITGTVSSHIKSRFSFGRMGR